MVTLPIAVGRAFGVRGRERSVTRVAMLDYERPISRDELDLLGPNALHSEGTPRR